MLLDTELEEMIDGGKYIVRLRLDTAEVLDERTRERALSIGFFDNDVGRRARQEPCAGLLSLQRILLRKNLLAGNQAWPTLCPFRTHASRQPPEQSVQNAVSVDPPA